MKALSFPAATIGVMLYGQSENERATFAIGCFLNQPGVENPPHVRLQRGAGPAPTRSCPQAQRSLDDQPQMALTMRATWLPWYDECTEGRGLWHLGLGYSYRTDEGYRANGTRGHRHQLPSPTRGPFCAGHSQHVLPCPPSTISCSARKPPWSTGRSPSSRNTSPTTSSNRAEKP